MHAQRRTMLLINLFGGAAVIGSYIWGFLTYPDAGTVLWGGLPDGLRRLSTAWMPLAVAGYFFFSYFLLFRLRPDEARIGGRVGFAAFNAIYALILFPSVLWIPLSIATVEGGGAAALWATRLVLWAVGLGSLALIAALLALRPRSPAIPYWLAVAGSVAFAVQTVVMDAVLWVAYFP